jgi:HTH-type transcriptional regulator/antitoxin MqsA
MINCVVCGSLDVSTFERERILAVGGREIRIPGDIATKCASCGEEFYTGAQAREADRKVVEVRRLREGHLSGENVRKIRQALGMSQSSLEKALGIGAKTIVRWENGTSVQSRLMDSMLRLVAFNPDNLRLLARLRDATDDAMSAAMPEDRIKDGQLQAAIIAGLEDADVPDEKTVKVTQSILSAIHRFQEERIEQFVEKAQYA